MNYDVNYFIKKFEAIPEDKWGVGDYERNGKCCAYGHCGMHKSNSQEGDALEMLFRKTDINVIGVNDGEDGRYKENHPKQRILAALYDIKKLQQKEHVDISKQFELTLHHTDITKQLAVLPVSETSDLITTNILQ